MTTIEKPDGSGYIVGMDKPPKRPRDPSQLAKMMVDIASGEASDLISNADKRDPAAAALGKKGGESRAKKLSPERRSEIARKAAQKRHS